MSGIDVYGSPWLVVYCSGQVSEDVARLAAEQCRRHGLAVRGFPIDMVPHDELYKFSSLVISLPTSFGNLRHALRPVVALTSAYRGQRRPGLHEVRTGKLKWFDVGALQIVGTPAVLGDRMLRQVRTEACHVHRLDDEATPVIDVLTPFHPPPSLVKDNLAYPGEQGPDADLDLEDVDDAWRAVREYSITTQAQVVDLLDAVDQARQRYENKTFTKLYRPYPGIDANMLSIILDHPVDLSPPPGYLKKDWVADRARVCRTVGWPALWGVVPGIRRPTPSGGGKDSTLAFRNLYDDLKRIRGNFRSSSAGQHDSS